MIHATPLAIQPVAEVFSALWPQAACSNLLDDSLPRDLQAQGLSRSMVDRMVGLATYAQTQNAQAILFTCSAFGPAIDAAKKAHDLPILKPNEAMFDEALDLCQAKGRSSRIGLLTTFAPASASMHHELTEAIAQRGLPVFIELACAEGAMQRLQAGDTHAHDQHVLETARRMPACDVYLLGQFSMARCQALLASALGRPVLSSPVSAVRRLQAALT